jgi:hypothetical protein
MVSLAALRWLADQDASFAMLERNGKVLAVTGPVRPSDAKLKYGMGIGLVGVLFLGIIFGPIAIYFGVRARRAAVALGSSSRTRMSAFVIGLGVFDILFSLIRIVGTIRLAGSGG